MTTQKFSKYARILLVSSGLILLANNHSHAQARMEFLPLNLLLESKIRYGFLIPHHKEMHILNAHFPSFEINLSQATFGKSRWEYMYNYPIVGLSFWFSDLGSSPYLGKAYALYPFINFPLTERRKGTLSFRLGVGLGYISKPFDRIENYKNIALGSHLNAAVNLLFEYSRRIDERFYFNAGLGLTHFSNGSIKTPNFGINIPAVSAGIAFRLNRENPYQKSKLIPELYPFEFDGKKFFDLNLSLAGGLKNMDQEYGKKYTAFSFSGNAYKRISYKSKIGLGFDFSYDGSDVFILERRNIPLNSKTEIIRPGVNIAYELIMSRFSIVLNLGMYLSGKERSNGDLYEKLAFKIHLTDKIFTNLTLKAHAARADYLALGIGYKIKFMHY